MSTTLRLTRHGLVLAMALAAMFWAAVNYDNNLVYFLLFLVLSVGLVSSVYAYRNVQRLELLPGHVSPVFAGDELAFNVQVINPSQEPSWMIALTHDTLPLVRGGARLHSVGAAAMEVADLAVPVTRRGRFVIREMAVSSAYPLGMLRAVAHVPLGLEAIVYPKPAGNRPWPETVADYRTQDDGHLRGGDDFYGVRPYRPGESQRHIDWKAVARGRPLMVKEYAGSGTGRLWFDWQDLPETGTEERISQLAQWVIEADEERCRYGLRLPGREIPPGTGAGHYHECLRALALLPEGA